MTPRRETCVSETSSNDNSCSCDGETVIVRPDNDKGPCYVRCTSKQAFCNPTSDPDMTADQVNKQLNLHLGQTLINPENRTLLWMIRFLNNLLFGWWEHLFFGLWNRLPVNLKRSLIYMGWKLYLPLHKLILGRKTAIHPHASLEYHALTTLMWAGRLFPVTVPRMRFLLHQITVWTPTPVVSRIESISNQDCHAPNVPDDQVNHCQVEGLWVHAAKEPTEYVLFWVYGGAFLSGDAAGNLGPAERLGRETGMDVFLPTHRLVPEAEMKDLLWDICLAFQWLCRRRVQQGRDPRKILLLGMSSGAGLVMRLLQSIAECQRGQDTLPAYLSTALHWEQNLVPMPRGAVLLGPFVDYTHPKGSLVHYPQHDLIVNPRVLDAGLPYLDTHMSGSRHDHSPVNRSFENLPPLLVVTSEHEAVYDHAINLVNQARAASVPVTLGVWKYMCHAFPFLFGFCPEAEQSMQFAMEWLRAQQQQEE